MKGLATLLGTTVSLQADVTQGFRDASEEYAKLEISELYWNVEFRQWRTLRAREQLFCPSEALGLFSQALRAGSSLALLSATLKPSLIMVFIDYGLYSALGLTHLLHLWRMYNSCWFLSSLYLSLCHGNFLPWTCVFLGDSVWHTCQW